MNAEKLRAIARDLRKTPPRSPRETLGGFVIGARMLDRMIGLRLCDLTEQVQGYFETYISQFCHPPSKVKFFFDVYDVEEGVL
jgi:hypothetical protein